jgi:hypothetical protein
MTFCPPGLLSIQTDCDHVFDSRSTISRAIASGPDPAGCDSTKRTGLSGQAGAGCA